jgi:hypothetical protein
MATFSKKQMKQTKALNIIIDDRESIINKGINKNGNGKRKYNGINRFLNVPADQDDTMIQNLIKEKTLLKQWKRQQFLEKRTNIIIRDQARLARHKEKQYLMNDRAE